MKTPLISVIIPVYNAQDFLAEALQSVMNQDYRHLELIVVDDGSTDESKAVAMSFSDVTLLQKGHSGVAETTNLGIRRAKGAFLAFLDADDRWRPEKLVCQIDVFDRYPKVDMVFGLVRQFWHESSEKEEYRDVMKRQRGIHKGSMLIRRRSFEKIGDFTTDAGIHHFIDWYARALDLGLKSYVLPDVVYERRIHDHNLGRTKTAEQRRGYINALRKAISRRHSLPNIGRKEQRDSIARNP